MITMDGSTQREWYMQLQRPSWAPPAWVFGPVWSLLYCIIIASFGYVFWRAFRRTIPVTVCIPFVLNLVFNIAFTPIQFGLRNNELAAADVLLTFGTLVWLMIAVWPHARWVAYTNVPY